MKLKKFVKLKFWLSKHKMVAFILFLAIVFALPVIAFRFLFYVQQRPVIESAKTEMKQIPKEVKNQIAKVTPTESFRIPVFMYHYVEYIKDKKDILRGLLNVTPYTFEAQLQTLKNAGFTFLTAKDLGDILDGKVQAPQKPILLTFDDGHWDFDTEVLPLLKKYNVKATSYIISGFIGRSDFMTQQQLQDVVNSNLVDVGVHTIHHVSLKGKLLSLVQHEVVGSKTDIENTYHVKVVSFAYPNGSFDMQAINVVKDAGFTTAVSTLPGEDDSQINRFFIYRLRPGNRTGNELLSFIASNPWTPKLKNNL